MHAAIYARISQDRQGDQLGVTRQLVDCRGEAARRGWTVTAEYVDDDVSAYGGRRRPQYEAMMQAIRDGKVGAVVVWDLDRLTRQPKELEDFAETCTRHGVNELVSLHGTVNLASGDGMLIARIKGAVAARSLTRSRCGGSGRCSNWPNTASPMAAGPVRSVSTPTGSH